MERADFSSHISEHLNRNLETLFNQVLEMGGLVEQQLTNLSTALTSDDIALAKASIKLDKLVNREEMEIDRICASVLARQQPNASDLRLIVMAIRMGMDLERMGDEAVKVANFAMQQCAEGDCAKLRESQALTTLLESSREMLQKTLNAFAHLDVSEFMSIYYDEERMDGVLKEAYEQFVEDLTSASTVAETKYLMDLWTAVRAAERLTDHALNLAESIVYLTKGKDVREMDVEALKAMLDQPC